MFIFGQIKKRTYVSALEVLGYPCNDNKARFSRAIIVYSVTHPKCPKFQEPEQR
jgi:hypothetical protein